MSDSFPAEITIGGKIPASLREELAEALEQDGAKLNWDNELSKNEIIDMLNNKDNPSFTNDQACYGTFEETTNFCRKNKIDFDHYSDAYSEFDGEAIICRNGEEKRFIATQTKQLLVSYKDVREVMGNRVGMSIDDLVDELEKIAPHFSPLEPIEWTK
jgi:hypothetical protein